MTVSTAKASADYESARQAYYAAREPLREAHRARVNAFTAEATTAEVDEEFAAFAKADRAAREGAFGMPVLELAEADEIRAGRSIFNGCDGHYFRERYGDRVLHVMGVGWFLTDED